MKTSLVPTAALVASLVVSAAADPPLVVRSDRGDVVAVDADAGVFQFRPPTDRHGSELLLSSGTALLGSYAAGDPTRTPLVWTFTDQGDPKIESQVQLALPEKFADKGSARRAIVVEVFRASGQLPDGRIVFGTDAVRRSGNDGDPKTPGRLGLRPNWNDASETLAWRHPATRPGKYVAELTCALAGEPGADNEIELTVGDQKLTTLVKPTGRGGESLSGIMLPMGALTISGPGEIAVSLRCTQRGSSAAILDALAITLRPACEGRAIVQSDDGSVICHARDVTIHGVQVQYEPRPEKNTVGYWTNPRDRVSWEFTLTTPGRFDVEILQGCGKDAGGSDVELSVDEQPLRFVVEDTGHFQNFVARNIGTLHLDQPGRHTLLVKPLRKAGVAVMDLRQVRLVPVP